MTETKTETLVDVLKELSSLAPERFIPIPSKQNIRVTYGGSSRPVYLPSINASHHAHVLYACMEECEARGFGWSVEQWANFPSNYLAEVARFNRDDGEHVCVADSPALALATALRDAIKAEEL